MIYSFDVFDTLLMRVVGCPESLFLFVGRQAFRKKLIPVSAIRFALARVDAERQVRYYVPRHEEEVELTSIYAALAVSLHLPADVAMELLELELSTEAELLRLAPGALEKVSAARAQGRVVFVSDMYLPGDFIRGQLKRFGLWQEGDKLYLSSEQKRSKGSGALYQILCEKEQVAPSQVVHLGNSPNADVEAPRRKGLNARLFAEGNLNRYEKQLELFAHATEGLSSLFAGTARLARLSASASSEREQTIRNIGCCVAGPLLAGFVLWILRSAIRQEIKRLYFVSRDGQILLRIAEVLAPKLGYRGELRYLYGGRQTWHLAALTEFTAAPLDVLFAGVGEEEFITPAMVLARANIEADQQDETFRELGLDPHLLHRELTPEIRATLETALISGPLGERVLSTAAQLRSAALGYLRQEGMFDDVRWAMVDVGWCGRVQASLGKLLASDGGAPPRGFYFGLRRRPKAPETGDYQAYFYDEPAGWGMNFRIPLLAELIEIFCSADHGLTVGYREDKPGHFTPILREDRTNLLIEWGVPLLQRSILAFAGALWLESPNIDLDADLRPATERALGVFWERPTPVEARIWANFPFEEDQAGTLWRPVTIPLSPRHAWGLLRHGKVSDTAVRWEDGSWAITPPRTRLMLNTLRRIGRKIRGW